MDGALALRPGNKALWEGAIHFEESLGTPDAIARALRLYARVAGTEAPSTTAAAAAGGEAGAPGEAHVKADGEGDGSAAEPAAVPDLSEREREEMSLRAVELADMFGDPATLAQVR